MYSLWTYKKIVPLQSIDFIQNLADEAGNIMDPAVLGMPPDFPMDIHTVVIFRELGSAKTEMTVTEYDWEIGQMSGFAKMGLDQSLDKMVAIFETP